MVAEQFLAERIDRNAPKFEALTAADVSAFVLSESRRWSVSYTKYKVTALRSLLRFIYLRGGTRTQHHKPSCVSIRRSRLPCFRSCSPCFSLFLRSTESCFCF
jgi:hypothetical protein